MSARSDRERVLQESRILAREFLVDVESVREIQEVAALYPEPLRSVGLRAALKALDITSAMKTPLGTPPRGWDARLRKLNAEDLPLRLAVPRMSFPLRSHS